MAIRIDDRDDFPTSEELRDLAKRARQHGMTLAVERTGSRIDHVVSDPRDGSSTYVTGLSCTCRQFVEGGGACQHFGLLLDALGWIPGPAAHGARWAVAS